MGSFVLPRIASIRLALMAGFLLAQPFAASASFTSAMRYAVGDEPEAIAIGDLNGDGFPDLAVANNRSDNVSVLLGAGDATFGAATHYFADNGPTGVAIADLNADGIPDLAVSNRNSDTVTIHYGLGDGAFAPCVALAVGNSPACVVASDYDSDGDIDLLTGNLLSNDMSVLRNNANGTFTLSSFSVPGGVRAIVAADMDGNGRIDILAANNTTNTVSMYRRGPTSPQGGGTSYTLTTLTVGTQPYGITVGDFDQDGDMDVAVANAYSSSVSVALRTGTNYSEGAYTIANYALGTEPGGITVGDFDEDGDPDLAAVVSNGVRFLDGAGAGSFMLGGFLAAGSSSGAIEVGDLDGDGDLDLVTTNWGSDDIAVFRRGPLAFSRLVSANEENGGRFGVSVTGANDITGDALPDVLVGAYFEDPGPSPSDSGRAYLFPGDHFHQIPNGFSSPSPATSGQFGRNVRGLGDVNGDGLVDLVISAPGESVGGFVGAGRVHLFEGTAGTLLRSFVSPASEAGGQFGARANGINDVTGDGKTDLLVTAPFEDSGGLPDSGRAFVFNSVTGALFRTFVSPNAEANGRFGLNAIGIKDVTGDGKGDLLVGAPGEDPTILPDDAGVIYLFNGATGAVVWQKASPLFQAGGLFGSVVSRLDDVTGDGKMDVAVGAPAESNSGRVHLFNGATGAFLRTISSPNPVGGGLFGQSITNIPDTNGDGWGDLVIGAPNENAGYSGSGRAYVVSGRNGVLLRTLVSPDNEASAEFGFSVGTVPDLDGNGYSEYVVGARKADPGAAPADAGRAYVFYGELLP